MKKLKSINPVLRAVIAQKWEQTAVTAQIQALMGGDPDKIADSAGRVVYVILGASLRDGLDADNSDVVIVRDAASALYDLSGADSVPEIQREKVINGLQACGRLCEILTRKSMIDAACDLTIMLWYGDLHWAAFEDLGVTA